jgi:NADPH:quinone reductase-like Zn-dependent oxidoreductase
MSNQAAWIASKGARLTVDASPYPTLEPGQVIIKNGAVAINPVDWKMQDSGHFVKSWPTIFGCDVAGEVLEVGDGVTNIKQGQRVLGHAIALLTGKNQDAGFQLYSSVPAVLVAPIPDEMSFEDASVIPLSVSTAAAGLYEKFILALPHPSTSPKPSGSSILIWGGSSSVGSSAIQLAVASGLRVVSTASKRNFEYVKSLGAETVIDHSSSTVVDDLVKALKGGKFVGAYDSIGLPESIKPVAEVVSKLGGGMIADVLTPPSDLPKGVEGKHCKSFSLTESASSHLSNSFGTQSGSVLQKLIITTVFAISIKDSEVCKAVYEEYLPKALKDGSFKPMPKATIIGKGLESLQEGFDQLKQGVSATKLVVSLQ